VGLRVTRCRLSDPAAVPVSWQDSRGDRPLAPQVSLMRNTEAFPMAEGRQRESQISGVGADRSQ